MNQFEHKLNTNTDSGEIESVVHHGIQLEEADEHINTAMRNVRLEDYNEIEQFTHPMRFINETIKTKGALLLAAHPQELAYLNWNNIRIPGISNFQLKTLISKARIDECRLRNEIILTQVAWHLDIVDQNGNLDLDPEPLADLISEAIIEPIDNYSFGEMDIVLKLKESQLRRDIVQQGIRWSRWTSGDIR
jgi:hypothetical protein